MPYLPDRKRRNKNGGRSGHEKKGGIGWYAEGKKMGDPGMRRRREWGYTVPFAGRRIGDMEEMR